MICVNDLLAIKCNNREVLSNFCLLLSSYAPHISEELWSKLGNKKSICYERFPDLKQEFLLEQNHKYPISFNGKMRFVLELPTTLTKQEIEKEVLNAQQTEKYLQGKTPKKIIVVPKKIVNIVF